MATDRLVEFLDHLAAKRKHNGQPEHSEEVHEAGPALRLHPKLFLERMSLVAFAVLTLSAWWSSGPALIGDSHGGSAVAQGRPARCARLSVGAASDEVIQPFAQLKGPSRSYYAWVTSGTTNPAVAVVG